MTCKTCIKHATHFRLFSFTTCKQSLEERPKAAYTVPMWPVGLATSGTELGGFSAEFPRPPAVPQVRPVAQVACLPFHGSVMCSVIVELPSVLVKNKYRGHPGRLYSQMAYACLPAHR